LPRAKKAVSTKTLINYIVDESGSMGGIADQVRTGFVEYVGELKKNAEGDISLTLTTFNTVTTTPYVAKPIKEISSIDYQPGGMTALYDAISSTIKKVESQVDDNTNVITVIMTDGFENSSRESTEKDVNNLITAKQATGRWTFVFLGADQDAWATARGLGLSAGNVMSYDKSGHQYAMASLANATVTRTSTASSSGVNATLDYFSDAGQNEDDYKKKDNS
jgi:uncharacterized protein YegL